MKIAKSCLACGGTNLTRSPAVLAPFISARVFGWEPVTIDDTWKLRDIPKGNALAVCNSIVCDDCGMLFLDMRFDDEEMAALYANYRDARYAAMRDRFEPDYSKHNALLLQGHGYLHEVESFVQPHLRAEPRVLDWGGDTGLNTPFRNRAALHHVYDISGCPVIDGAHAVDLHQARATEYDLINFSNVLEHVPSPQAALSSIASVMRDQTILYVEVPHEELVRTVDDPQQRCRSKRHWHEHINFFSEASLDRLFARSGLRILEQRSRCVSIAGRDRSVFFISARLS